MNDAAALDSSHNLPALTVSEVSAALKRTVEDAFGYVRIRGEISQPKVAGSGHCYMRLKDENAVIDAIIWRGTMSKLSLRPEEGMEVVASGRITTYPGRSSYQIIIDSLELAGVGALLKLLEERRKKLAAEGLFDAARKKDLPYLPEVVGVVTSPTGAVIRDILHRISDRFPRRVILWPVRVQGEGSAEEVAAAIRGFNDLKPGGAIPRPDVLIVARGGGSLEDLWAFNEEVVVRAAADSDIPLISAVGHETDTTLIDYASDRRAPTPTAAAEMAVPVRLELVADVTQHHTRLVQGMARLLDQHRVHLEGLMRGIPRLESIVADKEQTLDALIERFKLAPAKLIENKSRDLSLLLARLNLDRFKRDLGDSEKDMTAIFERLKRGLLRARQDAEVRLEGLAARIESVSPKRVLDRGYAIVRHGERVVTAAADAIKSAALEIEFADGRVPVQADGGDALPPASKSSKRSSAKPPGNQGSLF